MDRVDSSPPVEVLVPACALTLSYPRQQAANPPEMFTTRNGQPGPAGPT